MEMIMVDVVIWMVGRDMGDFFDEFFEDILLMLEVFYVFGDIKLGSVVFILLVLIV